jgi:hypothetical protein
VDADGRVSAAAAGTAVITVTTEDGGKTASCTVTVTPPGSAMAPVISGQPQSAVYSLGAAAAPLAVTASSPDGGTLSYQWYRAADETGEGTAVDGAAASSCTPPTDTLEIRYYYAVVTNAIADNGDGGTKTASLASARARIEVNNKVNAQAPAISAQPQSADYDWGATAAALTVTAAAPDGGTLSYQWYSSAANTNSGGTAVDGETAASYTPAITALGTVYYYVVVTNTIADNGDGGTKAVSAASAAAAVSCSLTSAAAVGSYITDYTAANPGTGTAADPVPLRVTIDLASGWMDLLSAIQSAAQFVALDLSACAMTGTEFDPGTANTGESKIVSLVLPDAAQSVKASADYDNRNFRYFTALKSVEGRGVTAVGDRAFGWSSTLTRVSLPMAVTIGEWAFCYTSLETLSLPAVQTIGNYAFEGCDDLTTVDLPAATSIGEGAFFSCDALEAVNLPAVQTIGGFAFDYCPALETVTLPATLTSIGANPFSRCVNLSGIIVDPANPNYTARDGMLLNKAGTTLVAYPGASGSVTLDASITIVGQYAFSGSALTAVNLPGAVTISQGAFVNCTALATADLPAATSIGYRAFDNCDALATLNLPAATSISMWAFRSTGGQALEITLGSAGNLAAPRVGINIFESVSDPKTVTVKVPSGATGYGTIPAAYDTDTVTENWANAFRGMGWNETSGYGAGYSPGYYSVNGYITLNIVYE